MRRRLRLRLRRRRKLRAELRRLRAENVRLRWQIEDERAWTEFAMRLVGKLQKDLTREYGRDPRL